MPKFQVIVHTHFSHDPFVPISFTAAQSFTTSRDNSIQRVATIVLIIASEKLFELSSRITRIWKTIIRYNMTTMMNTFFRFKERKSSADPPPSSEREKSKRPRCSTVFYGCFVTRLGSVIRYTGALDKAIKRETIGRTNRGGITRPYFHRPLMNRACISVSERRGRGRTRPRERSPGVLGDGGMLAARVSWSIWTPNGQPHPPLPRKLRRFVVDVGCLFAASVWCIGKWKYTILEITVI